MPVRDCEGGSVRLKIYMTQEICARGCCGGPQLCSRESGPLFPGERENSRGVSELLAALKKRYGSKLMVSIINPWSLLAMWDSIRFGVNPATPVWIMDGKKIFEGVPEIGQLQDALDEKLGKAGV
jgi:hypothetical protein